MKRVKGLWAYCLIFSIVIVFISCGLSEVIAKEKKPKVIRIASIGGISGPYAGHGGPNFHALKHAIEYVNTKLGGVKGVPLELVIRDTGGKVDVAISHYMDIREMRPKPLFISMFISGEQEALNERCAEDGIIILGSAPPRCLFPPKYMFAVAGIHYPDWYGGVLDWILTNWKETRPLRIAILTWDTSYGRLPFSDAFYAYAKAKGVKVVAYELFGIRDVDVNTQMLRIRNKNPDWILTSCLGTGPVAIGKAMQELKYKVNWINNPGSDWGTVGINPEVMEGAYCILNSVSLDEVNLPGVKVLKNYVNKYNLKPREWKAWMYEMGWPAVLIAAEATKRAVDEVGWENLDGAAVKAQLEKMSDFAPLGLANYTYTQDRHSARSSRIYQIKNGKILPVSDWFECPDLRPAK